MKVKKIMTQGCECIGPDATLAQAAQRMKDLNIGGLPICDNDRLAGMVTDRDITIRGAALGSDPKTAAVRDVMTKDVIYCFEDQDVEEAACLMEEKQIRRLPVLSQDKRLVGVITLGDIAVRARDDKRVGKTLVNVSAPSQPQGYAQTLY
jgi:CBS domain-containing protein